MWVGFSYLPNFQRDDSPAAIHLFLAHHLYPTFEFRFLAPFDDLSPAEEAEDSGTGFVGAEHDRDSPIDT